MSYRGRSLRSRYHQERGRSLHCGSFPLIGRLWLEKLIYIVTLFKKFVEILDIDGCSSCVLLKSTLLRSGYLNAVEKVAGRKTYPRQNHPWMMESPNSNFQTLLFRYGANSVMKIFTEIKSESVHQPSCSMADHIETTTKAASRRKWRRVYRDGLQETACPEWHIDFTIFRDSAKASMSEDS